MNNETVIFTISTFCEDNRRYVKIKTKHKDFKFLNNEKFAPAYLIYNIAEITTEINNTYNKAVLFEYEN